MRFSTPKNVQIFTKCSVQNVLCQSQLNNLLRQKVVFLSERIGISMFQLEIEHHDLRKIIRLSKNVNSIDI